MRGGAPGSGLVGRRAEFAQLVRSIDEPGGVGAVIGEPGIGKTALVHRLLAEAGEGRGHLGGALATVSQISYLALRRAVAAGLPSGAWVREPAHVAAAVAAHVADGVLAVEDLQWADPGTLAVLELLAGRVRLVLSVRSGDTGSEPALALVRRMDATEVLLRPLETADALTLLDSRAPGTPPNAAAALLHRAAGNPMLLVELAAGEERVASVVLGLLARLRPLPQLARQSMTLLALAGGELPIELVAGVTELQASELVEVGDGRVVARHALLLDAIVERIDPARRRGLRAALAAVLGPSGGPTPTAGDDRLRELRAAVAVLSTGAEAGDDAAGASALDAATGAGAGGLTARELDVVALVGEGLTDRAIANRLGLSVRTVETHLASARRKLGAGNRRQAALLAGADR
ncbi:helix-turn-helix transcriptional regulator [Nocardioides daejeonensis]|uniref:helix-turn-helix transcriptional regulator n=1 Tax=Nocardioides daejeonensis TaxID=1046556 RepID=UPI001EF6D556|nr:LuxR family transcriptional regulator [Nocardioides daejeonensis]